MSSVAARRDPAPYLMVIGFLLLYAPLLPELVRDWSGSGDFSHGFLVPFVAVGIAWLRRDQLRAAPRRAFLPGGLLLALSVVMYILGVAASEFYLQRSSMVAFLGGWLLLVWGPAFSRPLVFPVAFLLFMIPPPSIVWNAISFPLQLLATRITVGALTLAQVEVVRAGNVLELGNCSLEVAQACSGLRSLVTLMALGAVVAEGSVLGGNGLHRWWSRWLLFLFVIPIAVAVNALRVATTALAASRFGPEVATGTWHEASGLVMFAVSLGILWLGRRGLEWIEVSVSSRPS